jgi:hypothetical protein
LKKQGLAFLGLFGLPRQFMHVQPYPTLRIAIKIYLRVKDYSFCPIEANRTLKVPETALQTYTASHHLPNFTRKSGYNMLSITQMICTAFEVRVQRCAVGRLIYCEALESEVSFSHDLVFEYLLAASFGDDFPR